MNSDLTLVPLEKDSFLTGFTTNEKMRQPAVLFRIRQLEEKDGWRILAPCPQDLRGSQKMV